MRLIIGNCVCCRTYWQWTDNDEVVATPAWLAGFEEGTTVKAEPDMGGMSY
ncbi:MAG: hypothetical protein KDE19_17475 [Caldilineaceae bacterium]|nr:hypothetical protein [Caldilineaceae bacterium]